MKMILTLTKNEFIKLFRKKSVPILLALILLLVLGISFIRPINYYYASEYYIDGYYPFSFEDQIDSYKSQIIPESILSEMEDFEKANAIVNNNINNKKIDILKRVIELGIKNQDGSSNWKLSIINNLLSNVDAICYYEYVNSGGENADYYKTFYSNEEYISIIAEQESQLKALEENNYAESQRGAYKTTLKILEVDKTSLEKAIAEKDAGKDITDLDIFKLKGSVTCSEKIASAYEHLLEKKYDFESVQNKTVKIAINNYTNARSLYYGLISEEEYNNPNDEMYGNPGKAINVRYDGYTGENESYEEYYENSLSNIEETMNMGAIALYSLENDVIETSVANSTRQKMMSFINIFWFIAPLAIFFASGMVAKEFSTKTINLLLIRPVKRWKILLSKYICLFMLVLGMIVASLGVYLIGSGISMGFSDLSQPHLYIEDGTVHAVNFVVWLTGRILFASLPVFCLITITFMLSSVTKGSAVSLIIGVLTLFSSIFVLFFYGYFENTDMLTYLPFSYFSMWSYVFDDVVFLEGSAGSIFSYINDADILYGIIILAGITALSLAAAFTDFNKKDIK